MRQFAATLSIAVLAACVASHAHAELTSPQVGWQAELSTFAHGVSGTVTILDDNTIQVDDFTYDGGGIVVYFYLGETESSAAFVDGVSIGPDLRGTSFDGTQEPLVYDLLGEQTLEGLQAISVWCVTASANFGSGTFAAVPLLGDYNDNGFIDAADYTAWRDTMTAGSSSLTNDPTPGTVDETDFAYWRDHFGELLGSGAGEAASAAVPVPEPATLVLAAFAATLLLFPSLVGLVVTHKSTLAKRSCLPRNTALFERCEFTVR